MMIYQPRTALAVVLVAVSSFSTSAALMVPRTTTTTTTTSSGRARTTSTSSSSLSALPPMIIGPMIRKMRNEKEEKKRPLADPREAEGQAPGLKVGANSWKWPSVWPYDANFLQTNSEAQSRAQKTSLEGMTSLLSGGIPGMPAATDTEEGEGDKEDETIFKPTEYWSDQEATSFPMDKEAEEKLASHYNFYLRDGMSILELGAGENSYLPADLKPSRHVGVGLNPNDMEANPSITENVVVDLNKVEVDRDVDSDELRALADEPFDVIIMSNTIPFLTSPREVFRTAWHLLKPGGIMMVAFSAKASTQDFFPEAQTVMWRQYNDDQHMWITGSFFEFSASEGWESVMGFDISPESAKDQSDDGIMSKVMSQGKDNNVFVVQATKAYQDEAVDPENPERYINAQTWMLPVLEGRDKQLVVPRLARAYQVASSSPEIRDAIVRNTPLLPTVYEALMKMDQFAFTFSMQAQMAADLICDPDFNGSEEQMLALREGLGLRKPGEDLWLPIGQNTAAMEINDKINLLSYIVPKCGSNDPAQEDALKAFVTGIKPTYEVIRSACPELKEPDVQLLGTELLASEVLTVGRSTRQEFATWLGALSASELREILAKRKSYAETATVELEEYKRKVKEEGQNVEEYQRLMKEQVQSARQERSMVFNPRSQKMEIFDNPNNKKSGFLGLPFGGGN